MEGPIGVAVIGAGNMGQRHLRGWQRAPGASVVALADVNLGQAQRLADDHSIPTAVADYRQAIDRPDVNAVSICTPACFHPEVTVFAAQAGKQVLCEKAMALAEADRMLAAARRHDVLLVIGFNTRMAAGLPILRRWLGPDGVGRPALYRAHELERVRPNLTMHERQGNGGPIIDTCCHKFDLWSLLFGMPRRVFAHGWTWGRDKPSLATVREPAVDTAAMLVEFERGDVAQMAISWGLPEGFGGHGEGADELIGPWGVVHGTVQRQLRLRDCAGLEQVFSSPAGSTHEQEVAAFAHLVGACLAGQEPPMTEAGRPPLARGADGLRALAISLAVLASIETGRPVELAPPN